MDSLYDYFKELDLAFCVVTETWFYECEALNGLSSDAKNGHNLCSIHRYRRSKGANGGGGVSIFYNKSRITLTEYKIKRKQHEIVCAKGRLQNNTRPFFVIGTYISTKCKAIQYHECMTLISEAILKIKTDFRDPYIVVGGDLNHVDLDEAIGDYPDIEIIETAPSRGSQYLDQFACSFRGEIVNTVLHAPLKNDASQSSSDHGFLLYEARLRHCHDFTWVRYRARQITDTRIAAYDEYIRSVDWEVVASFSDNPSDIAHELHRIIEKATNTNFPYKDYKVKSTDDPWIDDATRTKIDHRKGVFEREGRDSRNWREMKTLTNDMIKTRKKKYYMKEVEKLSQEGAHLVPYKALKNLAVAERPPPWTPGCLFPHMPEPEVAEEMAEYFGKISQKFAAVDRTELPRTFDRPIADLSRQQITDRLTEMKKPRSSVTGDPLTRFVNVHAAEFSPVLERIFNLVRRGAPWPKAWRKEEVTVIPKGNSDSVESLDNCRNISCTSIFSKLLESYMLDDIQSEVSLESNQYGGQRGCGTDHLLAEMVTRTMQNLDDNRAVDTVISLDFRKAFNKMDHTICLRSLAAKGASNQTLQLVCSFLSERSMVIKHGRSLSAERLVPGGAPQGTKSGNFLYCVTVDGIEKDDYTQIVGYHPNYSPDTDSKQANQPAGEERPATDLCLPGHEEVRDIERYGLPDSPKSAFGHGNADGQLGLLDLATRLEWEDRPLDMDVRTRRGTWRIVDSSSEEEAEENNVNFASLSAASGLPDRWIDEPMVVRKFIDDTSGQEKIPLITGVRHITSD